MRLSLRGTVILLGVLSLACAGKDKDGATDADSGSDGGDSGGDSGSGDSGGGDSGTGDSGSGDSGDSGGGDSGGDSGDSGPSGPCPTYSGYSRAGVSWEWQYTEEFSRANGISGGWEASLTELTAGGEYTLVQEGTYDTSTVTDYQSTYTADGYCDADGAWITSAYTSYSYRYGGQTYTGWVETTYDPPYLSAPAGLEAGDRFSVRSAGVSETSQGTSTPFDTTYQYTVGDPETITVPAGTFTALPITYNAGGTPYTYYVERDIGGVYNDASELVSYTR